MSRLLFAFAILVFGAECVFAGGAIVNSEKISLVQLTVMPDQSVSPYFKFNSLTVTETDELGAQVERDIVPEHGYIVLDGSFNVHTKVTEEAYYPKPGALPEKGFKVEGSITCLGVEAYAKDEKYLDEVKDVKYLIKGDYRFSETLPLKVKEASFVGTIPFKLVDTNSNEEYFLTAQFMIYCTPTGCYRPSLYFGKDIILK